MEQNNGSHVGSHLLDSALNVSLLDNKQLILDEGEDNGDTMWSMEVNPFNDFWYSSIMILLYGVVCTGCIIGKVYCLFRDMRLIHCCASLTRSHNSFPVK